MTTDPDDPGGEPEDEREPEPEAETESAAETESGAAAGERTVHPAVYASNWRTVLLVDAAMGGAVVVAGIVLAVAWNFVAGGILGSIGVWYVLLVVQRGRQWAELRRDAGL